MLYSFDVFDFIPAALFLCSGSVGIVVSARRGWREHKRLLCFSIADILLCLCLAGAALLWNGGNAAAIRGGLIVLIGAYIVFRTKRSLYGTLQKNPERKEGRADADRSTHSQGDREL